MEIQTELDPSPRILGDFSQPVIYGEVHVKAEGELSSGFSEESYLNSLIELFSEISDSFDQAYYSDSKVGSFEDRKGLACLLWPLDKERKPESKIVDNYVTHNRHKRSSKRLFNLASKNNTNAVINKVDKKAGSREFGINGNFKVRFLHRLSQDFSESNPGSLFGNLERTISEEINESTSNGSQRGEGYLFELRLHGNLGLTNYQELYH